MTTRKAPTAKKSVKKLKLEKDTIKDLDAKDGKKVRGGIIAVLIGDSGGNVSRFCTRSSCR